MEPIVININFEDAKTLKDCKGSINIAENREGVYNIHIRSDISKMDQVGTLMHEWVHLISDLYFGLLDLKIPEEDLCKEMETTLMNALKGKIRKWK